MMQKKGSLIKSFGYAFQGIFTSLAKERNLKIHFAIAILVVIFGFLLKIALWEWIVCLILFGLVISLELANTAIEEVVDLASPKWHEKAKRAKDAAAGAVLFSALISAVIGIIIFAPKLFLIFNI